MLYFYKNGFTIKKTYEVLFVIKQGNQNQTCYLYKVSFFILGLESGLGEEKLWIQTIGSFFSFVQIVWYLPLILFHLYVLLVIAMLTRNNLYQGLFLIIEGI